MISRPPQALKRGTVSAFGVSGSGKSFQRQSKEIASIALSTNDDILILDPESEFGFLVEALGGEITRISAASNTHLNALDMDKAYGDERNPLIEKAGGVRQREIYSGPLYFMMCTGSTHGKQL